MKRSIFTLIFSVIVVWPAAAQHDYEKAIDLSTYFLGAQRSGDNDSWIHGASHTQDGVSLVPSVDLEGGWHDCGDYIKFSFTNNWAATMYLAGIHFFPAGYPDNYSTAFSAPPSNGIPDILDEVKIQTDFIIKSYNGGAVVQQVGHGDYDHSGSFSEPVTMSAQPVNKGGDPRPVYIDGSCTNIIGSAAAALALMSIEYRYYDVTYADECLQAAKDFFALGKTKSDVSCGSEDCSSGGSPCYNLSTKSSNDEMAMAAASLYAATSESQYLTDAENYYNASEWAGEVMYYGNMNLLAAAMLYESTGTASYLNKLKDHFDYHSNPTYSTLGFYKYQWSGGWGNLQYTGNEAFMAAVLHLLDGGTESDYYDFAKNNVDFILGSHDGIGNIPANFSFLIGYNELGGGYPLRPHHKAAFGSTKLDWSLFTLESNTPGSVAYAFELKGALVGGPDNSGNYYDEIDVFQNSEVCTYYNAGFSGALAYVNKVENNLVTGEKELFVPINFQVIGKQLSIFENGDLQIINSLGQVVFAKNVNSHELIDLSHLNNDVYFLNLNGQTKTGRFIIK